MNEAFHNNCKKSHDRGVEMQSTYAKLKKTHKNKAFCVYIHVYICVKLP